MFDFHMHSFVSFDGHASAVDMAQAAVVAGMKEICFTDHVDDDPQGVLIHQCFDLTHYAQTYDHLQVPGLVIRKGLEFGLLPDNQETLQRYLRQREFDFVIGSIHYADGLDVYYTPYWEGKTLLEGERRYLENILDCIRAHDHFDVLGHLTYIGRARANPVQSPVQLSQHREVVDEIFRVLIDKGKGLECNSSGVDRIGAFLPTQDYLRRFKELGGRIVTIGSDAHNAARVGQYMSQATQLLKEIFGYVCTFEAREPVFHKL